jgi:hypothetical protein
MSDDPGPMRSRVARRDPKKLMAKDELQDIIRRELNQAIGAENGKLSNERQSLMAAYQGQEFADPPPGQNRSRVVMLTVLETVEWVLPALLRIFTASDTIANLEPIQTRMNPPPTPPGMPPPLDPEEAARQASLYVNHVFNVDNDGFLILHDWFKDGLLQKLGWVKRWWSEEQIRETNTFTGLTEDEYNAKLGALDDPDASADVEILEEHSYPAPTPSGMGEDAPQPPPMGPPMTLAPGQPFPPGALAGPPPMGAMPQPGGPPQGLMAQPPPMMGNLGMPPVPQSQQAGNMANVPPVPPPQPMLYDCKIRVTRKQGRIRIKNVPPEEILFSRRSTRDDIPFLCHRQPTTRTELLQQGYDEDCLDSVGWTDSEDYNSERLQRFHPDDDMPYTNDRTDPPMRMYWVEENYIKADYDGDGLAELLKVVTVDRSAVILTKNGKPDIEEVDEVPFDFLCPVPQPHKLVGLSVADLVMDLQRIKSTLIRQMLDNIYLTNNPRHLVVESAATDETYDDLLTSKPGGIVRARSADGVTPLITPFVAEKAQGLVEYMDQTAEVRTGISRHNQGLDPDDLNKTATGVNLIQQAAAQRVELIARIYAFAVQKMVRGILGLVRKHAQQERIIRVSGAPLQTDPAQWKDDMTVTVSVGLGTGNRDQIMSHLMALLTVQQQIVTGQGGFSGPLVYGKNIYDTVSRLAANAGFKSNFAVQDPTVPPPPSVTGPPQPPKPDPQAQQMQQMAQMEMQLAQQKTQAASQLNQQKAGAQQQLTQQKAQMEMQHDASLQTLQAQHEHQLNTQKMQHDFLLQQQKQETAMSIERLRAANQLEVESMKARNAALLETHKANLQPTPEF